MQIQNISRPETAEEPLFYSSHSIDISPQKIVFTKETVRLQLRRKKTKFKPIFKQRHIIYSNFPRNLSLREGWEAATTRFSWDEFRIPPTKPNPRHSIKSVDWRPFGMERGHYSTENAEFAPDRSPSPPQSESLDLPFRVHMPGMSVPQAPHTFRICPIFFPVSCFRIISGQGVQDLKASRERCRDAIATNPFKDNLISIVQDNVSEWGDFTTGWFAPLPTFDVSPANTGFVRTLNLNLSHCFSRSTSKWRICEWPNRFWIYQYTNKYIPETHKNISKPALVLFSDDTSQ